jgi:integrase
MIGSEEAAGLTDIPNIRQQGTRLGNWLPREQAKELLAVPDRSTLKGKRDCAILALLVGCALRRHELANLSIYRRSPAAREPVGDRGPPRQRRPGPHGGGPGVGQAGDQRLDHGRRHRGREAASTVLKSGKVVGESLSDWAVWSVVEQSAKEIGIERFGAHDLRRTCAKLCRKNGGDLEQIKFLLGHSSIQTERYLGSEQESLSP